MFSFFYVYKTNSIAEFRAIMDNFDVVNCPEGSIIVDQGVIKVKGCSYRYEVKFKLTSSGSDYLLLFNKLQGCLLNYIEGAY